MFGDSFAGSEKFQKRQIKTVVEENVINISKLYGRTDVIKYIDISSIDNQRNEIIKYTDYSIKEAPSRAQQLVQYGDILVSTVRPNLRNVAMVKENFSNLIASTGFFVLRPSKLVKGDFLFEIAISTGFAEYLARQAKGANYPAVSGRDIEKIEIPLPPLPLQTRFAEIVQQIDKGRFVMQEGIKRSFVF